MKSCGIFVFVAVLCAVMIGAYCAFPAQAPVPEAKPALENVAAVSVADAQPLCDEALGARFLNMLNRNYAYDTDFQSFETLVNDAVTALTDLREGDYVAAGYVSDYLASMYGIVIDDYSSVNTAFPQKDGYVYIIPRGYTEYAHQLLTVSENEDDSYTVCTRVTVKPHDGEAYEMTATSLFVPNEESDFGYVMVYSNLSVPEDTHTL